MANVRLPFRARYPAPTTEFGEEWSTDLIRALTQRDREVNNALQLIELTTTFAIDDTGLLELTIDNVFGFTPALSHCQLSVVAETDVDDWAWDLLLVSAINSTSVTVKINRTVASTTTGATARINVWVRPGT